MSRQTPLNPCAEAHADTPVHALSLAQASALIRQATITPVQLVQACIDRMERLDAQVNAFVTPTLDAAMQAAHQATREIAQGQYRGPLHGIPMAHKDVYLTQGVRTTAHSRHLHDWVPTVSTTLVTGLERLGVISWAKRLAMNLPLARPQKMTCSRLRATPGIWRTCPAVPAAAQVRPWRQAFAWRPRAPTPAAPSATRQPPVVWWVSSQRAMLTPCRA